MDRKAIVNEYKQRKEVGGIFRILNTKNGMYFLDCAANLQAKQNGFDFMIATNSCMHYELKAAWAEFGSGSFTFEVLEQIEKKKDQSAAEFNEDLVTLLGFWKEKLDPAKRYK
jgi:hypothetical protein